jgi:hypothetical protein
MVGVTASDIARLNVVVLPSPATPSAHAGCRIALGFLAIDGRVVKQDIRTVYPGRATHFDLSGVEAALPPGPVALRIPVRPVVEIAPIQTGDVCRMVASFELFDSTSGRGLLFSLPAPMVGPQ